MGFKEKFTFKEFIMFLIPSIAVMAFMSAYAIVDGYFVSTYVGSDALAAMNLILPINSIIFSVGLMFAAGGGAFAAIKLGEGDSESASSFFSNLLVVAFSFGALVMLVAFLFKDSVLGFLGVNESLYSYASTYSRYTFITFPLLISKMIFAGFLRAQGKPTLSLKMSILGGVVNMILDYLFIGVLRMGVAGAGLATMLGIASALIYAGKYFSAKEALIHFKIAPIDFKIIGQTMVNGSSEMISELAVGFTTLVLNLLTIQYLGNDGAAAIAVILYINFFASMIFQGIAIGVSPLLSFYYGAKNYKALKEIRTYARYLIIGISILTTGTILVARADLVSLFFSGDSSAYAIAIQGMFTVSFAYLFMGMNMYGSAMYTAFSNGKVSAFISITKTFVIFSITALLIPKIFGGAGIWLILPIVELAAGVIVFYFMREKQLRRFVDLDEGFAVEGGQHS